MGREKVYIKDCDKHSILKPADLRVGNWMWFDNDTYADRANKIRDNWFQVAYVSEDVIGLDIGFEATQRFCKEPIWSPDFEALKPIPLTPEILEACGFENDKITYWLEYSLNGGTVLYLTLGYYKRQAVLFFANGSSQCKGCAYSISPSVTKPNICINQSGTISTDACKYYDMTNDELRQVKEYLRWRIEFEKQNRENREAIMRRQLEQATGGKKIIIRKPRKV